jgi:hypothetical protein
MEVTHRQSALLRPLAVAESRPVAALHSNLPATQIAGDLFSSFDGGLLGALKRTGTFVVLLHNCPALGSLDYISVFVIPLAHRASFAVAFDPSGTEGNPRRFADSHTD